MKLPKKTEFSWSFCSSETKIVTSNMIEVALLNNDGILERDFKTFLPPEDYKIFQIAETVTPQISSATEEKNAIVAVVDICPDKKKGLDLIKQIKQQSLSVKTLVITDCSQYLMDTVQAGADGFLLKEETNILPHAVKNLAKNHVYISPQASPLLYNQYREYFAEFKTFFNTNLTTREKETLRSILTEGSRTKAAEKLGINLPAIKSRINKILRKLNMKRMSEVVNKYGKFLT